MQFQQQQLPSFATLTRKTLFPSYIGIALFLAKKIASRTHYSQIQFGARIASTSSLYIIVFS